MIVYHQFVENENLLLQKAIGEWSTEYYLQYVDSVFLNEKMIGVKKILTDFRNINLEKALKDIEILIGLREKMIHLNYLSVVIISPKSVAVTHLYQSKVIPEGFEQNYCSTMEGAIKLLSLNKSEKEMESFFREIENQS